MTFTDAVHLVNSIDFKPVGKRHQFKKCGWYSGVINGHAIIFDSRLANAVSLLLVFAFNNRDNNSFSIGLVQKLGRFFLNIVGKQHQFLTSIGNLHQFASTLVTTDRKKDATVMAAPVIL
jgi:hypothetical protein